MNKQKIKLVSGDTRVTRCGQSVKNNAGFLSRSEVEVSYQFYALPSMFGIGR